MIKIPIYNLEGNIIGWSEEAPPAEQKPQLNPDEQRDLLLAQLLENQLLMLNGMGDLVKF